MKGSKRPTSAKDPWTKCYALSRKNGVQKRKKMTLRQLLKAAKDSGNDLQPAQMQLCELCLSGQPSHVGFRFLTAASMQRSLLDWCFALCKRNCRQYYSENMPWCDNDKIGQLLGTDVPQEDQADILQLSQNASPSAELHQTKAGSGCRPAKQRQITQLVESNSCSPAALVRTRSSSRTLPTETCSASTDSDGSSRCSLAVPSKSAHHDSRFIVAFHDADQNNPLAFVNYRFEEDDGRAVAYCYELQVDATAQGCGLGKRLMLLLETAALSAGMQCIVLTVQEANKTARQFYERLGFALDETDDGVPGYSILSKQLF